jgi:hypothetical protein
LFCDSDATLLFNFPTCNELLLFLTQQKLNFLFDVSQKREDDSFCNTYNLNNMYDLNNTDNICDSMLQKNEAEFVKKILKEQFNI